jgi:hypothetical protein
MPPSPTFLAREQVVRQLPRLAESHQVRSFASVEARGAQHCATCIWQHCKASGEASSLIIFIVPQKSYANTSPPRSALRSRKPKLYSHPSANVSPTPSRSSRTKSRLHSRAEPAQRRLPRRKMLLSRRRLRPVRNELL